jgi:hypothetical protein
VTANRMTFEAHFTEAVGAGLDPTHRAVYEAHWDRHTDLQGTHEGRAEILDTGLALARRYWDPIGPPRAEHPDFKTDEGHELDPQALALHQQAETYSRRWGMDYADVYRELAEGRIIPETVL